MIAVIHLFRLGGICLEKDLNVDPLFVNKRGLTLPDCNCSKSYCVGKVLKEGVWQPTGYDISTTNHKDLVEYIYIYIDIDR